jgi:ribosomal protein S18 acetylase RimI-like enzyme
MLKECCIPDSALSRFRDERLSTLSPLLADSSDISSAHRWNVFFHCSIQPQPDLIRTEVKHSLKDVYRVSTLDDLVPKYVGEGEQWGALVSPGVGNQENTPMALIDHWFVTDPSDFMRMFEMISVTWPWPFNGIRISISALHRCFSYLQGLATVHLEECVYGADWKHHPPSVTDSLSGGKFSVLVNQQLDQWLPDLWNCFRSSEGGVGNLGREAPLVKNLERSLETGGLLTLYDSQGFAGMVSWYHSSDAELLLLQYWHVPCIYVRPDLRNKKVGQYLYGLASRYMDLEKTGMIGARVQVGNVSSQRVLEKVGAERMMEYFMVSS